MLPINKRESIMKKRVFIKIDCNLEKELDKTLLANFFDKLKMKLKLENNLPEKKIAQEKKTKI